MFVHTKHGGFIESIKVDLEGLRTVYDRAVPEHNKALAEQQTIERHVAEGHSSQVGGLATQAEAIALVETGWREGSERLSDMRSKLALDVPAAQSRRRKRRWGSDGELDIGRALEGRWEVAFRSTERRMGQGMAIVDLVCAWGGNWNMTAEQLFWDGAQMLVLCEAIESAGYAVRLTAMAATSSISDAGRGWLAKFIQVKDSSEPLTIDALAGVVCHAGIYRSFGFRMHAFHEVKVRSSLGHSESLESARRTLEPVGAWPAGAIVVDHAYSRSSAVENIRRVLDGFKAGANAA